MTNPYLDWYYNLNAHLHRETPKLQFRRLPLPEGHIISLQVSSILHAHIQYRREDRDMPLEVHFAKLTITHRPPAPSPPQNNMENSEHLINTLHALYFNRNKLNLSQIHPALSGQITIDEIAINDNMTSDGLDAIRRSPAPTEPITVVTVDFMYHAG